MKGEVITTVIAIAIIVGSAVIAVNMINPTIEEGKSFQTFNDAKKVLEAVDSAISQVFFEAPGARRVINVDLPEGKFIVSGGEEKVKIRLEDLKLFTPGVRRQEGNILVTSGSQVDSYEGDVDGDGSTDLVLENDAVKVAIKKLGNQTSPAFVNTTNMIVLIKNKRTNTNIWYPRSGIYINESSKSYYGVGYSELTQRSDFIASAGVHLFINATDANIDYDAVLTLGPAQDFFEFYITHVNGL